MIEVKNILDSLAQIKPVNREIYGYDKNNKPNEHCNWSDFFNHWEENDLHYRKRLNKEGKEWK